MHVVAQTNRITIREFLPEELETFLAHFTDEKVTLYLPKRSKEERITIFNNALNQYKHTKACGIWGIFDNTDKSFIGSCLLRPFDGERNALEFGYSLEQKYWGQGLATEMATAVITHGFVDKAVAAIIACTELPNLASQRVLKKTRFKYEANLIADDGVELARFRLSR
jgi:[ribosomal protein S5]-alanine N-acetyltransferase